jgi:hypothetical protein
VAVHGFDGIGAFLYGSGNAIQLGEEFVHAGCPGTFVTLSILTRIATVVACRKAMIRIATVMQKSTLRRDPAAAPRCVIWGRGGFGYQLLCGSSTTSTTKQAHNPEVDT